MNQPDPAYVTLALVPGIGRTRLEMLLATFGSAEAALGASLRELSEVTAMSRAAATAVRSACPSHGEQVIARTTALGGEVLLPTDLRFPQMLRSIPDAPTLLFARGKLSTLNEVAVAIVGSRTHTRYGAETCRHFASGLARAGLAVVSGMARGLDAVAHTACLDAGGVTVGVLGNGLGVVYPAAHRGLYDRVGDQGCLITEFPPGERPHAGSFPRRNRLISGLARCTLVVEAREKSGALITVECALAQGREVMAVPGPITSPTSSGSNRLIQHGAKPALGLKDVLEEYGLSTAGAKAPHVPEDLTALERRAFQLLGRGVEQVDDVATQLNCSASHALSLLTKLELRGLVVQEPGKLFRQGVGMLS